MKAQLFELNLHRASAHISDEKLADEVTISESDEFSRFRNACHVLKYDGKVYIDTNTMSILHQNFATCVLKIGRRMFYSLDDERESIERSINYPPRSNRELAVSLRDSKILELLSNL